MRSRIRENQVLDKEFISPEEHEGLHNRDAYIEIVRANGKVIRVDKWRDSSKLHQVSSTAVSRLENKILGTKKFIYDYATGSSIIATVTGTLVRSHGKVVSIIYTRDNDMEGI